MMIPYPDFASKTTAGSGTVSDDEVGVWDEFGDEESVQEAKINKAISDEVNLFSFISFP